MASNGVVRLMEKAGIELTLDNYLMTDFFGDVPPLEELDGEYLSELEDTAPWFAAQIRKQQRTMRGSR
jgi:hypothetical protein